MKAACEIAAALSLGWKNAAEALKKWMDSGTTVESIRQVSVLGSGTWKKLLDILEGVVCPELANVPACVYHRMRLLTPADQRSILQHGIDMAVWDTRTQVFTVRKVMPGQLRSQEAKQVFGFGLVHTLHEQQRIIQEVQGQKLGGIRTVRGKQKTIVSIETLKLPYDIRAKDVVFWYTSTEGVSVKHTTLTSIMKILTTPGGEQ